MLLVTVLVAGAVSLLIGMSIALGSIFELAMGRAEPKTAEVSSIADGCVQEALLQLSRSSAYAGGSLSLGNGNCTILVNAAGSLRTIWVTASLDQWMKALMAKMNVATVEITDWQESPAPACGDGTINQASESCDGADLNGETCTDHGFNTGTLSCDASCDFSVSTCANVPPLPTCGNGTIDAGENCDGTNLNGQTCVSRGFDGGTLSCASCAYKDVQCNNIPPSGPSCGNGSIGAAETCDGANLGGETCTTLGFSSGTLSCNPFCSFSTINCANSAPAPATCGNGILNTGESCDGTNLNGQSCAGLGFGGGALSCTPTCTLTTMNCTNSSPPPASCGNSTVDWGENCDGTTLNGQTCTNLGFSSGTLSCNSFCSLYTANCVNVPPPAPSCGNGVLNLGESCDGSNLNEQSCVSLGFDSGTLSCTSSCSSYTANCTNTPPPVPPCGDGILNPGENCDGANLNGQTCASLGFKSGALSCSPSCSYYTANCTNFNPPSYDVACPVIDTSPIGTTTWRFDMNDPNVPSPTATGYTGVSRTTLFSGGLGYGWDSAVSSYDRGGLTPLLRDMHASTAAHTFSATVTNGYYLVSVTIGDRFLGRDKVRIAAEGVVVLPSMTVPGGQFLEQSFVIQVTDGRLDLAVSDLGGSNNEWSINSIEIRPGNLLTQTLTTVLAPTSPTPFSDGVTIDTVNGTNATPNSLVTVTVSDGMITTADASTIYYGIQVLADGSGNFSFMVRRPTGGVTSSVNAEEVTGAQTGCRGIAYTLPTWRRLDMNASVTNVTQTPIASPALPDGYLSVLETNTYTTARGFGWNTAVSAYDRSSDGGYLAQLRQEGQGGTATRIFRADFPNATYWVNITQGDRNIALSKMRIRNADVPSPGGFLTNDLNTLGGKWTATGFAIPVLDGSLNLEFSSLSVPAVNPTWLVNGIEIHPAADVQGKILLAADSVNGPAAPADGTTTRTIRGATNLLAGSVISVTSSLGTITTADVSAAYTGIQVQVIAGGGFGGKANSFTFTIKAPTTAVIPTPKLTALEVAGKEQTSVTDTAVLTFTPVTTWRFDFNSSATNVTAAGFMGINETELFALSKGYGWASSPQGIDRGGSPPPTTIALYQDGDAGASNTTGTFRRDLPNGTYDVRVYVGDRSLPRNGIQVRAEASAGWTSVPATAANAFTTATFTVTVSDGMLDFEITQIPGNANGWILNGIDIAPTGTLPAAAP